MRHDKEVGDAISALVNDSWSLFGAVRIYRSCISPNAAPLKKNLEQAAPPNPARLAHEAGLKANGN
jgi:hypothetical protein